jgi:DNA-binding SARP family transcriptional activator
LTVDGQPINDFATDKVRALLVYLALEPGRPQSRQFLVGLLWPDVAQTAALTNLRITLFRLRQTLARAEPGLADSLLTVTRHTIQLNLDGVNVDVHRLDTLIHASAAHPHSSLANCDECLTRLAEAVSLYRGELLAGFSLADAPTFQEWLLVRREMAHQTVLKTLHDLAAAYEQRGQTPSWP